MRVTGRVSLPTFSAQSDCLTVIYRCFGRYCSVRNTCDVSDYRAHPQRYYIQGPQSTWHYFASDIAPFSVPRGYIARVRFAWHPHAAGFSWSPESKLASAQCDTYFYGALEVASLLLLDSINTLSPSLCTITPSGSYTASAHTRLHGHLEGIRAWSVEKNTLVMYAVFEIYADHAVS
jgi:hypothetical protein